MDLLVAHQLKQGLRSRGCVRKHDYRFSHEPYGVEVDAFVRATEVLAGGSRELLGHGPVELPESPESAGRPR